MAVGRQKTPNVILAVLGLIKARLYIQKGNNMPTQFRRKSTLLAILGVLSTSTAITMASGLTVLGASLISTAHAEEEASDPNLQSITVFGRGETRQVSEIGKSDIAESTPGSSPLKVLARLPGVNFNSVDAQGNYEWGSRISIRGFSQNQLGFTLDDVPLGDMSYRNFNGLHISRAISSENIGRVVLSQGTGSLGTASTSNLGGTVQFYTLDPSDKRGATAEQTFGSNLLRRTYARFDSGLFENGAKFSLSYTDQNLDKWTGHGHQEQQQVNTRLVKDFDNARFSAFVNFSDQKAADYMDLSKSSISRLGYDWDFFAPNWDLAKQVAQNGSSGNITSPDDAYYNGSTLRRDWLAGATLDYSFSDNVSLKTTLYHHDQKGTGTWWTPYRASPGGTPISLRTLEFDINRSGALSALTVQAGKHKLETGLWYEHNDFDHAMRFYAQDNGPSTPYRRPSNPYSTNWNYAFKTETLQFHAQDTFKLDEQWTLSAGFKSPYSKTSISAKDDTEATTLVQDGSLTAKKGFLPQVGVNFKLDERNEFFASAAQNIRAYRGIVKGGTSPFDTTQAGFDAIKHSIKPEESITYEAGWRFRNQEVETGVTIYHIDFKNRLLALQQGTGIQGNPSVLANVGEVQTNGIEASFDWKFAPGFRWYNSLSYNDSKYKDDFSTTDSGVTTTYRSSGKQVVDAPKVLAYSQISYQHNGFFANFGGNYTGKRYYTYVNDNSAHAYVLWDTSAGYRWKQQVGIISGFNIQAGINNLFDKKYYAFGDNPTPASDPNGEAYLFIAGTPRTGFVKFGVDF